MLLMIILILEPLVYDEVGRFALASKVEKRMIHFWARVSQGKKSKLSCIIYSLLRKLHASGDFESRWTCES